MVQGVHRAAVEEGGVVAVAREALRGAVLAVDVGFTVGLEASDGGRGLAVLGCDGDLDVSGRRKRRPLGIGVAADSEAICLCQHKAGQNEGHESEENRADAHVVLLCTWVVELMAPIDQTQPGVE